MRSIQVFRRGRVEEGERVRQGPAGLGASAPQTHLTLVNNLADMIKWQVDGLQVVCQPVTQLVLGKYAAARLRRRALRRVLDPFPRLSKRKGPTIIDGADALAFEAVAVVAPAVLTRSECDAKGA